MSNKLKNVSTTFLVALCLVISILSCKSSKQLHYITNTETLGDTLIRHEVESVILPQRNVVVFENPCKEDTLSINSQIIENEHSTISVTQQGKDIYLEVDIDSIVNSRLAETRIKDKVTEIEVPIEVPYPVKNKLNWYLVAYAIGSTIVIFRKPLFYIIRKLIIPIP